MEKVKREVRIQQKVAGKQIDNPVENRESAPSTSYIIDEHVRRPNDKRGLGYTTQGETSAPKTGPIFVKAGTKPEKTKGAEPEAMKERAKTTTRRQGFQGRCYQCGEPGHIARYCRRKPAQEESTPNHELHNRFQPLASIKQCFKCGNTGHIARSCQLQAYQKPGPRSEPICY